MTDLETSRPAQILEAAREQGRLPHGILLFGDALDGLQTIAHSMAGKLLKAKSDPVKHPDFFALRPANKMRQIGADETRATIHKIQQTANQGGRKVTVVYEADRMNKAAANAFLKTLEEPPGDTTIFLLSTRPYDLLPTIRSRCMNLRLPAGQDSLSDEEWRTLLTHYHTWLDTVQNGKMDKHAVTGLVLGLYGIVSRFGNILKRLSDEAWAEEKQNLPEDMSNEEQDALETGVRKGLRSRLLTELERATRDFAWSCPNGVPAQKLARATVELERSVGLLEVNFQDAAALELYMLRSLRIWSGR